jgi:uncharacterized protein with gpF-like domain
MPTSEKQQRAIIEAIRARKAKKGSVPRLTKKPAVPADTKPKERAYLRRITSEILNPAIKAVMESIESGLPRIVHESERELKADAVGDNISRMIEGIKASYYRQVNESQFEALARETYLSVESWNKIQQNKVFKSVLGVDPVRSEPWLGPLREQFTKENVALIKSVSGIFFNGIERIVRDGARSGKSAKEIANQIKLSVGTSKKKAAFLARDQVAKLNSDLDSKRQISSGVNYYIWRNARDQRVRGPGEGKSSAPMSTAASKITKKGLKEGRPLEDIAKDVMSALGGSPNRSNHRRLEGGLFSWNDPPIVSPDGRRERPGRDFLCRCYAEPVMVDFSLTE